jgi:superfamily II DNA or RNA helicase
MNEKLESQKNFRKWQQEALDRYFELTPPEFLIEATPGAGKTKVAAEIAARLVAAQIVDRIVVVVPTMHLRRQTALAFAEQADIQLDYTYQNGNSFPGEPFKGIVVTYSAVDSMPEFHRVQTSRKKSLIILDEIHHASDVKSWGASLRMAFENSKHRLLLSGTPFRSDNKAIPFVRYVDGRGQPDYSYGYADALKNQVVRSVYFRRFDGQMRWNIGEDELTKTFEDQLDEQGESQRLRTALLADGGLMTLALERAVKDLNQLRLDDPDAGGLVIAMDQSHARDLKAQLESLGIYAELAITDEPDAAQTIKRFTRNHAPWLVSVRMVSEGVDIPRLRILIYATNVVTELYFRQAVGRIVRVEEKHDYQDSFLYLPDDQRLQRFARQIDQEREAALDEQELNRRKEGERQERCLDQPVFVPLSSTGIDKGSIASDQMFTPEELDHAERVKLMDRNTARASNEFAATLFRNWGKAPVRPLEPAEPKARLLSDELGSLRRRNHTAVARIVYKHGLEFEKVNQSLNDRVGIRNIRECAKKETLEQRLRLANQWLIQGSNGDYA